MGPYLTSQLRDLRSECPSALCVEPGHFLSEHGAHILLPILLGQALTYMGPATHLPCTFEVR